MAADYPPEKIRNVVLLGHSHDGKTTLAEAMLFASGGIQRMGSTDLNTTTMDTEPEEQRRKISINLGVAFVEHNGFKINILDAPGFLDFAGQAMSGLRAAEGAVVVVGPNDHLAVGTEVAWEQCNARSKPRVVVVNKLDKEHADFYGAVKAMRDNLSPRPFPLHLPIGSEQEFRGVVDLLHLKAFVTTEDGKGGEVPIPDDMQKLVEEYRGQLIEAAAESDDALLEKYLDAGTLNEDEIQRGLREGILAGKVAPVLCCSATKLLGVRTLMSTLCELLPPAEGEPSQPTQAFVFSTGGDQFGRVSYFKVVAGTVKADQHLTNINRSADERLAQIFFPRGKEHVAATEVQAGDIGAATKLTHTLTGDTLGAKDSGPLAPIDLPGLAYSGAITQNFRASVQKGIVDNMAKGVVAGYPMVDVKVTLVDGKYHQVDSNDMAFQIAGSLAIRRASLDAGPVLLEPVVEAEIRVPEKNLGDIMSDINGRRGKIMGTEPDDGYQKVRATVPESEMMRFALDLRSITQGRGTFSKKFSHYDEMPAHLAKGIIEDFQKQHEAAS